MSRVAALRIAAAIVAVVALLLFAAAVRMGALGDAWSVESSRAIERYAFADRSLTRDMLSARVGLLRNYDTINQDLAVAYESLDTLDRLAGDDRQLHEAVARLVGPTKRAEALAEQFKSENALLQNSLARVTVLCNLMGESGIAGTLSARFLRLTLDTGPQAVAAAEEALAAAAPAAGRSELESQLVVHGRLLIELLPRIDHILNLVRAGRLDNEVRSVREHITRHQQRNEARQQRAFLVLLGASMGAGLLWLGLVAYLAAQARERRRSRENEQLSATVAGLLLEVSSEELRPRIEAALQRLAEHMRARDAYLVVGDGKAGDGYLWSADGRLPSDWPRRIAAAAQRSPGWDQDMLHIAVSHAPGDPLALMLRERGIDSMLLIRAAAPIPAILGFERYDAGRRRSDVVAGLRMAQAALLQALRRDRMERARLQLELRLARARRMEAIGAVASGVAHNFNNIIGAIGGFSEIAGIHAGRNQVVQNDLSEIRQAVDRARELVDEILAFGRGLDAERKPLALDRLLGETVRLVRASGRGGVALTTEDWPGDCRIAGNAAQLQQVFMNICNNAFQAMERDPHVDIELARRVQCRPFALSHGSLDCGEYAVVTIVDRGGGIHPAALPRIFEPFFTSRHGGTGLGLSTAWEIVQEHGGTIDVCSTPGTGSRFGIWLPVQQERAETPVGEAPVQGAGNGEYVLVAAPGEVRDAAEELVAMLGYEPIAVDPAHPDLIGHAARIAAEAILFADAPQAAYALLAPGQGGAVTRAMLWTRQGGPVALAWPLDAGELAAALGRLHRAPALQS